ncbi:MAG: hypothetical protein V5A27_04345 [Halapricum sp.]
MKYDFESIEFERTERAFGLYVEGIGVRSDGSTEVLDSVTIGNPREFDRIQAFEDRCKRRYGQ